MDSINNFTDNQIASILQKLKEADSPLPAESSSKPTDQSETSQNKLDELPGINSDKYTADILSKLAEVNSDTTPNEPMVLTPNQDVNDKMILPWFTNSDRDTKEFHYIKYNDNDLVYASTSIHDVDSLALLKLQPSFICDIDYFKSRHYVLLVKQLDCNIKELPQDETDDSMISLEDTKVVSDINIQATEPVGSLELDNYNCANTILSTCKYNRYIVYTDLGLIEFIAKSEEVPYPYSNTDLNLWLEEVSNKIILTKPKFKSIKPMFNIDDIREFKYDIITMHQPGVITLDSVDNHDASYQLNIKLKNEYSFLPLSKILMCLKHYSTSNDKSILEFRNFIAEYFDLV